MKVVSNDGCSLEEIFLNFIINEGLGPKKMQFLEEIGCSFAYAINGNMHKNNLKNPFLDNILNTLHVPFCSIYVSFSKVEYKPGLAMSQHYLLGFGEVAGSP